MSHRFIPIQAADGEKDENGRNTCKGISLRKVPGSCHVTSLLSYHWPGQPSASKAGKCSLHLYMVALHHSGREENLDLIVTNLLQVLALYTDLGSQRLSSPQVCPIQLLLCSFFLREREASPVWLVTSSQGLPKHCPSGPSFMYFCQVPPLFLGLEQRSHYC